MYSNCKEFSFDSIAIFNHFAFCLNYFYLVKFIYIIQSYGCNGINLINYLSIYLSYFFLHLFYKPVLAALKSGIKILKLTYPVNPSMSKEIASAIGQTSAFYNNTPLG